MTQLGLLGLAPLAAGAAGAWLTPWIVPAGFFYNLTEAVLIYAAAVISYAVGVSAGGALSRNGFSLAQARSGMIAVLAAWISAWPPGFLFVYLPDVARIGIVILVFVYLLARDRRAVAAGELPQWYGALRFRLTFWASMMLAAIIARLIV